MQCKPTQRFYFFQKYKHELINDWNMVRKAGNCMEKWNERCRKVEQSVYWENIGKYSIDYNIIITNERIMTRESANVQGISTYERNF